MRYAVLGGGKRLRPLLVYAAARALGVDSPLLDAPACAVELIHAYSLVHDDLPAMDDDALRRGRPTCHIVFGEAMAILAGDALQALAFELLADDHAGPIDPAIRVAMLRTLGRACGAEGMAGGQALDLAAVGQQLGLAELEHMHACKTGALIRASVRAGAILGGADAESLAALTRYGDAIGLAFQIADDILDVEGTTEELGKDAGSDQARGKATYPALVGLEASKARARELVQMALDALTRFDERAEPLRAIASYIVKRKS